MITVGLTPIPYTDAAGLRQQVCVDPDAETTPRMLVPFSVQDAHKWAPDIYPKAGKAWRGMGDWLRWDGARVVRYRAGLISDGASVPWGLRWYEGKNAHPLAWYPHDMPYQTHVSEVFNFETGNWEWWRVTKRYADRTWWSVLEHPYDVRKTKAFVLWDAVHVCGWSSWIHRPCTKCYSCSRAKSGACPLAFCHPHKSQLKGTLE